MCRATPGSSCEQESESLHLSQPCSSFSLEDGEDPENSEVLVRKFEELCLPVQNVIVGRHTFNTTCQKPHETMQAYVYPHIKCLQKMRAI